MSQTRTIQLTLMRLEQAPRHGWTLLFPERHPHAGGEQHYAAYLEDTDGFEIELIAPGTSDQT